MNHHVPEFDVDELYSAPSSSQSRHKNMQENEIMELVWHNGHLGVQNQNKRLLRKPSPPSKSQQNHQPPSHLTLPPPETASSTQLFMQEDEMTSWLHYPLDDDNSFDHHLTDLLYHPPPPSAAPPSSSARVTPPTELRPPAPAPQPQSRPPAHPSTGGINFPQFARQKARVPESGQSASSRNNERRNSTVVASNDTPKLRSAMNASGDDSAIAGTSTAGGYMNMNRDLDTYAASISGGSATATADLMPQPPADDRKRKGIESVDAVTTKYQSEDLEIESCEAKKQCRGTASGKRTRAAEVHNLSERKRRDRINEKMKALQELIPRCTKTDKASMLDEAIDYLKSLQMQLQMMSMGYYSMVPMMFPGVQQYMPMPPMGLGMGMGMDTRMNRPMVPFPAPVAPSSMDPRFQFPNFPPPVPPFDPSRFQNNPMEPVCNPNEPPCPNVYQQYLGAQQNTPISIPSTSKASTSLDAEDDDNNPSGTGISIGE